MGATNSAEAAYYYWSDYSDGSYSYRQPQPRIERQKPNKRGASTGKKEVVPKESGAKPQGPLVIAISIDHQRMTVYDSNGVFAESPVSTGMKGHSTPMGVFSVIQKQKYHRSNIYSGAPMPYMQRITWSGIAIHAGVLPGYPASHGCIRMPMAFAVKMWNWTKMSARVIVTPGGISPQSFSHPLLASVRVAPPPAASLEPQADAPLGAKADKGAPDVKSASAEVELRPSVGHVMSDATVGNGLTHEEAAAAPADEPAPADVVENKAARAKAEQADAAKPDPAKSEPAKPDASKTEAKKPDAAVTATPAQPAADDANKDQTRLAEPAPAAKPEPPKSKAQIAVFISRKDGKLYVRQNLAPLFEVPVTIAASDRPLGTHVFTAEVDKNDANALHWSVVSLPVSVRSVEREDEEHVSRRRRMAAAVIPVAAKPVITPDSPAEALDRISIPADTMAKINEMLTTGGSIIVSDQGINQGETGEGTDFIVRLR
jgi:hypothetical protein